VGSYKLMSFPRTPFMNHAEQLQQSSQEQHPPVYLNTVPNLAAQNNITNPPHPKPLNHSTRTHRDTQGKYRFNAVNIAILIILLVFLSNPGLVQIAPQHASVTICWMGIANSLTAPMLFSTCSAPRTALRTFMPSSKRTWWALVMSEADMVGVFECGWMLRGLKVF